MRRRRRHPLSRQLEHEELRFHAGVHRVAHLGSPRDLALERAAWIAIKGRPFWGLDIADQTMITAQSGISKNITKKGEVYMGSPAFEAGKYRKAYIHFRNLDAIVQRIDKLEKQDKIAEKS